MYDFYCSPTMSCNFQIRKSRNKSDCVETSRTNTLMSSITRYAIEPQSEIYCWNTMPTVLDDIDSGITSTVN